MKRKSPDEAPRYRALLELLRTAETIWNASRGFFAQWDLSPSQFNVLNLLRLCPEGLSQTELSRELIMHRSNVTGLVDRLEKRGLLERRDVADDRRAYRVVLTAAGRKVLEEVLPTYYDAGERVWEGFDEGRVDQITAELKEVASNAQRLSAALAPRSDDA
jgi:DNA-binding MarR family transcriptional regulator